MLQFTVYYNAVGLLSSSLIEKIKVY